MARSFFGSGFFPLAPPAELPEYVGPARAFFGDDDATAAYLAQLEAYAADGAEATDLLDAAEAAGDVATAIALLEGGGIGLGTYTSLQQVLDLIADGTLVEGQGWRIAWTGDLYIPDGEALGVVRHGKPSWSGVIPAPLIGVAWTVISGGVTYDADGRPTLTTTGAAPNAEQLIELDCDLGPALAFVAHTRFQATGTPSVTGTAGPNVRWGLAATPTTQLQSLLAFVGGAWWGAGVGFGNPAAAFSPSFNPSTTAPVVFEIDVLASRRDALPNAFARISHGANTPQNFDAISPITNLFSDWRSNLDIRFRLSNIDLGVPSVFTLTGLECSISI